MLVPVMQVRQMGMGMLHRRMIVPVRVGLGSLVAAVRVLVMLIVDMPMTVHRVLVHMLVGVPLGKYEPRGGNHQRKRDTERDGKCLRENEKCNRGADEWRGAEMRSGTRAAKMPQREDEQHKADAVTQETNRERSYECLGWRKVHPERERQDQIERSCGKPLYHRQHDGIGRRNLAREVVVETPAEACADNCNRVQRELELGL